VLRKLLLILEDKMSEALYCNSMTSEHYPMFCRLNYPQLDVQFYEDRSWSIIEFENAPLVPSLTQWRVVFSGFENVEFNESFVTRMIAMIDNTRREFWEREEEKQIEQAKREADALAARADAHAQVTKQLVKSDQLMARAAVEGPSAFSLDSILRAMPESQVRQVLGSRVQVF
jgi:hypothetical protein